MTMYISPYRRMTTLREAMNRLFEESMPDTTTTTTEREMMLAVDVQANDDAFEITALVPGLEADDLSIEIMNNTVSIRGAFKSTETEGSKYLTCELPAGRFSRVITMPTALDPGKVEAHIQNGVLHMIVPKAEAHKPKAIKVNMN